MSGPIVRRYGFPNFEKIFGERKLEHGADEPETPATAETPEEETSEGTGLPPDMGSTAGMPTDGPEIEPATEFGNAVD